MILYESFRRGDNYGSFNTLYGHLIYEWNKKAFQIFYVLYNDIQ